MKKRILAMLLVLCLVMSVMPMTVLAAEEAKCPGKNAEHNLNNCEYTFVRSVAAATCQQKSYDLYQCNECDKLFAENFGEKGPHNWVGESSFICGAWDGESGVQCEFCGAWKEHVYDCSGKCFCGEESEDEADFGHKWNNKKAVIVKAPVNCTEVGEAEITCDACGLVKSVAVYGVHAWGAPVEPKDKTCTTNGNLCYRKCANCDAYQIGEPVVDENDIDDDGNTEEYLYDVSGHLVAVFDEKIVGLEDVIIPASHNLPTEIKNVTIEAGGNARKFHTADAAQTIIIEIEKGAAALRISQRNSKGSVVTYDIPAGLSTVVVLKMAEGDWVNIYNLGTKATSFKVTIVDDADLKVFVPSTCYLSGRYQVECIDCKQVATVALGTTAHNWHLQASQAATCYTYGYEVYACIDCGKIVTVSYEPLDCYDEYEEIKAYYEQFVKDGTISKNELKKILEGMLTPAGCVNNGSYNWECPLCGLAKSELIPALGCDLKTVTIEASIHHGGAVYTYCARGNKCDCACTCNLLATNGVCICGHKNNSDKLYAIDPVLYQIVAAKGQKVHKILSTTAKLADNALNADAHDWVLTGSTATCKSEGEDGYVCIYCYKTKTVKAEKKPHEAYDSKKHDLKVVDATCIANGKKYYICSACDTPVTLETLVYNPFVILTDVEAQKIHQRLEDIEWLNPNEDPCKAPIYGRAYCADCKATIVVFKKGTGSHNMGDFKLPKPSCETQSGTFLCLNCGKDIPWEVKGEHKLPNPAVEGNCYVEGTNAWGECSVCHTYIEQIKDPAGHDMVATHDYVADCKHWGGNLYVCSACGLSEIYNYIPEAHDYQLDVKRSDEYAGCMTSGTQYFVCSKCGDEYSLYLEGLGHHVNSYGAPINHNACPLCNGWDFAADYPFGYFLRGGYYDCVYCGKTIENLGREATCTQTGYFIAPFTCGHNGYNYDLPMLDHEYEEKDYGTFTCQECIYCGAQKDFKSTGNILVNISDDVEWFVTDGSIVALTIDLSAYKTDLFGYCLRLGYNADLYQYVGFDALSENLKYNSMVTNKVYTESYGFEVLASSPLIDLSSYNESFSWNTGVVTMVGQAAPNAGDFNLTGEEALVTLYFKVIGAKNYCENTHDEGQYYVANNTHGVEWSIEHFALIYGEIYANHDKHDFLIPVPAIVEVDEEEHEYDVLGTYFDADVFEEDIYEDGPMGLPYRYYFEGIDYEWEFDHEIDVYMLMDANGDHEINYLDAAYTWQMASGSYEYDYDPCMDINRNGEIDHVDAKMIYQYVVGLVTYEEVLNFGA